MTQITQRTADATASGDAPAPKRMGRRSVEESRETRRTLLNAAVIEFSEKGMDGARIDEIAERAGVTKGAIYTHFDGREDLLVEACRSALRSLQVIQLATEAPDLATYADEAARRLLSPEARTARMLITELYASAMRSTVIAELVAEWHAGFVETVKDRGATGPLSAETVAMWLNLLFVALSHIDVHDDVDHDEVLVILNRFATALFIE